MINIVDKKGKVVRTSKSLRGLITHMGLHVVRKVCIREHERSSGVLLVIFENDDSCVTSFASYTVLEQWVANRRALKDVPIVAEPPPTKEK